MVNLMKKILLEFKKIKNFLKKFQKIHFIIQFFKNKNVIHILKIYFIIILIIIS